MKAGKQLFILVVSTVLVGGLALGNRTPVTAQAGQQDDPVLVGAGDITKCRRDQDELTAQLIDSIPGTVFTLGDNAYPDGTLDNFTSCYDPTWGRFKDRTRPVIGNHDYHVNGAAGYFTYFGAAASPLDVNCTSDCKGYYSYDLGTWHIIVLNSEIDIKAGSEEEQWLRADLAAHPAACTLAMWHEPLFSAGKHGDNKRVAPLWNALYDYGADVVLNGHDHTYQRFAPQDPQGQADPNGIREFVVGTGGAEMYKFPREKPNSEVRDNTTYGVLKLTLHATSYDWEFIPIAGETFTDSGSGDCFPGQNSAAAIVSTSTASPVPSVAPAYTGTAVPLPSAIPSPVQAPVSQAPLPVPQPSWFERFMGWISRLWGG